MTRPLNYQIEIEAPSERVWQQMLSDAGYRDWTSDFCEGSYFEGRWETGADMLFLGPGGQGMRARIEAAEHPNYVSIQHLGELREGKPNSGEDWTESFERYRLSETTPGQTRVAVELTGVPEQYIEMMDGMWPKALARLKAGCERD
ncbi:SRPBCC domain-containing protein [Pseudomarimonas arenosa]|uniref:SRPBCC domain-containing protein n=1 Tax=Pseudomarimonas arenosa TaxID=2774145 RepID=A0AAW3ZQH5_9GAMM|nr:SRPBCC domain-containing protein [Pseudomarimonas arenosa]MBD8528208.1 SRPBCC domain-containing protein [Pseudomarimonas arenosa]